MLKTISYSIVFVSKIENNVIINNLFDDINSTRTLRKDVIEKVFPNENITIENKGNSINVSQYITSNGFKMTFEKPLRMMIECNCNGDDKKEEYINLIAQKIIDIIKEERENNINGLISAILSVARTFIVLVVCLYLLSYLFQGMGLWVAWPVAELVAFIISIIFILKYKNRYEYL